MIFAIAVLALLATAGLCTEDYKITESFAWEDLDTKLGVGASAYLPEVDVGTPRSVACIDMPAPNQADAINVMHVFADKKTWLHRGIVVISILAGRCFAATINCATGVVCAPRVDIEWTLKEVLIEMSAMMHNYVGGRSKWEASEFFETRAVAILSSDQGTYQFQH
ncbi:hypothetical protein G7046_g1825 [Stylonectria norvegica]|nr:hypothetical protein G7046_g1825 [Stylonectria norvegica]